MPLEPQFDNIDDLDPANPLADDPVSEGDDHLRGIKNALRGNVQGDDSFTALLAGGFIQALVDVLSFTVKGPPLIDLDSSGADVLALLRARNEIGGVSLSVDPVTGTIKLEQTSSAGVFERQILEVTRDGEVRLFHPDTQSRSLRTIDRTLFNTSLEVLDSIGVGKPVGFNALPFLSFAANYTVIAAHNGFKLRTDNTARTITVPAALPQGFCITFYKGTSTGANVDTINATGGATFRFYNGEEVITGTARSLAQGGVCTISWVTNTVYDIWGNGGLT